MERTEPAGRLLGALDRGMRALVGLVAGTVIGVLTAEALGNLIALLVPLPRAWSLWAGCGAGIAGAVWLATAAGPPWVLGRARRAGRATRHGWVDLTFRAALGVVAGMCCGVLAAFATSVWLDAVAPLWRAWWDADEFLFESEPLLLFVPGMLLGALVGLLWFAADLPWLPGRRSARAPRVRGEPDRVACGPLRP